MKLIGQARHAPDAQRGAAPGIAVHLGQHQAGDGQAMVEGLGHGDRLLAGHGVHHQQRLGGRDRAGDAHQLIHHRLVDVQPAGGVQQDHVVPTLPRGLQPRSRDLQRGRADGPGVDLDPDVIAQLHELVHGGGPIHVGGHQQRPVALLAQANRQLGGGRRLARALQPDQHHHRRLGR